MAKKPTVGVSVGISTSIDDLRKQLKDRLDKLQQFADSNPININVNVNDINNVTNSLKNLLNVINNINNNTNMNNLNNQMRQASQNAQNTAQQIQNVYRITAQGIKQTLDERMEQLRQLDKQAQIRINTRPATQDEISQGVDSNKEFITSATIVYKDALKNIVTETYRWNEAQQTVNGTLYNMLNFDKSNKTYLDNLENKLKALTKIEQELNNIKDSHSNYNINNALDTEYVNAIKQLESLKLTVGNNNFSEKDYLNMIQSMEDYRSNSNSYIQSENERLETQNKLYKQLEDLQKERYSLGIDIAKIENTDSEVYREKNKQLTEAIDNYNTIRNLVDTIYRDEQKEAELKKQSAKLGNDLIIANAKVNDTNKAKAEAERQKQIEDEASAIRKEALNKYYQDQERAYKLINQYQNEIYKLEGQIVSLSENDAKVKEVKVKQLKEARENYFYIRGLIDDSYLDEQREFILSEKRLELEKQLNILKAKKEDSSFKQEIEELRQIVLFTDKMQNNIDTLRKNSNSTLPSSKIDELQKQLNLVDVGNPEQVNKVTTHYNQLINEEKELSKQRVKNYSDLNDSLDRIYKLEKSISELTGKNDIGQLTRKQTLLNEEYENYVKIRDAINKGVIDKQKEEEIQKRLVNLNEDLLSLQDKQNQQKQKQTQNDQEAEFKLGIKHNGIYTNTNGTRDELQSFVKTNFDASAEVIHFGNYIENNGEKIRQMTYRVKEADGMWHKYTLTINETAKATYQLEKPMSDVLNRQISITQAMKTAITRMAEWAVSGALIYGTLQKIREGIGFINEINKSQTNIQMITGMSSDTIKELTKDYSDLAGQLHETTGEIMKGAEEFLRAGHNIEETQQLLKASTVASKISGQDQKETSDQLIAITNGFAMNMNDVMGVIDKLSAVDNASATSFKELATAMQYTSASAKGVGVQLPELISYIGTVSSISRRSAETIGQSFRTIFSRYEDVKQNKQFDADNEPLSNVEASFNKLGISIRKNKDTFKDFDIVLDELAKR
jgi:DNA repair ATPase RecN